MHFLAALYHWTRMGEGGERPIGVGEVLRRIIGKALVYAIKPDIL